MEEKRLDQKKLLFVFNPRSGKGQIKSRLVDIIDLFVKNGYEVTAHPTQGAGDARSVVAERARAYDLVVCSGGDGTLDETISGMMRSKEQVPIGYIPAGSTNDFAQTLRIPKDMRSAAEIAVNGKLFPCDVGLFNKYYFIYVAAFGLFTDVSYQTSQKLKNVLGHGAYVLEGAKRLSDIPSYRLRIEVDGRMIEDDFIYGMITNATYVAGVKNMALKDTKLDDGLFEVSLIKYPTNPIQLNEILTNLMLPNLLDTEYVMHFKTDKIKISCLNGDLPWTLDGEFGGNHVEAMITNIKQAISLRVRDRAEAKKRFSLPVIK